MDLCKLYVTSLWFAPVFLLYMYALSTSELTMVVANSVVNKSDAYFT